jgi:glutaredoxin 3
MTMMMTTTTNVTIYTTSSCGYCRRAEDLLRKRGVAFRKIDVTSDWRAREELVERANGRRTVPVIFFDDQVVGGYVELAALDARGELGPGAPPESSGPEAATATAGAPTDGGVKDT